MTSTASSRPPLAGLARVTRLSDPGPSALDPVPVASVQGTLALDLRATAGVEAPPEPPALTLAERPQDRAGEREVQVWAATFTQAVLEVLGGDRPVSQLLRWTDVRVYQDLTRRVQILSRRAPASQRLRAVRPQVWSVRVYRPSAYAAEVSVHVRHGQRSRALAARLELSSGRWQCTALEFG